MSATNLNRNTGVPPAPLSDCLRFIEVSRGNDTSILWPCLQFENYKQMYPMVNQRLAIDANVKRSLTIAFQQRFAARDKSIKDDSVAFLLGKSLPPNTARCVWFVGELLDYQNHLPFALDRSGESTDCMDAILKQAFPIFATNENDGTSGVAIETNAIDSNDSSSISQTPHSNGPPSAAPLFEGKRTSHSLKETDPVVDAGRTDTLVDDELEGHNHTDNTAKSQDQGGNLQTASLNDNARSKTEAPKTCEVVMSGFSVTQPVSSKGRPSNTPTIEAEMSSSCGDSLEEFYSAADAEKEQDDYADLITSDHLVRKETHPIVSFPFETSAQTESFVLGETNRSEHERPEPKGLKKRFSKAQYINMIWKPNELKKCSAKAPRINEGRVNRIFKNIRKTNSIGLDSGGIDFAEQEAPPEMGYIVVEDCPLSIVGLHGGRNFPKKTWVDVVLLPRSNRSTSEVAEDGNDSRLAMLDEEESLLDDTRSACNDDDDSSRLDSSSCDSVDRWCTICRLGLQRGDGGSLQLDMEGVSLFNGLTSNMMCSACGNKKRSDAALVVGLVAACRADEVAIRRFRVFFKDNAYRKAVVVVTVTFPSLLSDDPGGRSIRSVYGTRPCSKPLHPGLQSLLSIIQSDWAALDATMQTVSAAVSSRHSNECAQDLRPSLFPPNLSFEDLYLRIQESPGTEKDLKKKGDTQRLAQSPDCHIAHLPRQLLVEELAPFLRARSLDALRCTCSYLHNTLRTVVPGLKLRLYRHQINSLSWMRTRESHSVLETDCVGRPTTTGAQSPCGDLHRAVTGGQTVLLSSRPDNDGTPSIDIRVNQTTGYELTLEELRARPRHVARGGLLCDDPGLGKTITVLSLILQTSGLTTDSASNKSKAGVAGAPDGDAIFYVYWRECMTSEFRCPTLLKLLNEINRSLKRLINFPVAELRRAVGADRYEGDFALFEEDVENAIREAYPDGGENNVTGDLLHGFRTKIAEFKEQQCRSTNRSHAKASSEVATLLEAQKSHKFIQSLEPSSATLLVIPFVLMEHWQTQIDRHVELRYCTDAKPLVFEFDEHSDNMTIEAARKLCQVDETHSPLIFLDKSSTRPLPPASFLAMFQVVITTTNRFTNEWKKGSFQQEIERSHAEEDTTACCTYSVSDQACPLLKVHWLRMVVDEGHSMGRNRQNSSILFASWISAERRWVMSGTPTKQSAAQIGQLLGLMRFLRHDFFSPRHDHDATWKNNVTRCWGNGYLAAFFRLRSLLGFLMKRNTKLGIAELPTPHFTTKCIQMSSKEVSTYNAFVCSVKTNILVTSMKGKISAEQDSLLHPSQAKWAQNTLANMRLVCTGWSRVNVTLEDKWQDFVDLLHKNDLSEEKVNVLRHFVHQAETGGLSECSCCSMRFNILVVLPCCGGLTCTYCMDKETALCPVCDNAFDIDALQKLQPGFTLQLKSNLEEALLPEGGPLPALEDEQTRRGNRNGDVHECRYSYQFGDGKCTICSKEHEPCNLVNKNSRCEVCLKITKDCPEDESKSSYLVSKLLELHWAHGNRHADLRPLKAIVFSQFRKALDFVGHRLIRKFGTACVAEYWGIYRVPELRKFVNDPACFCMLLSNDGSEGLDLSFVTHIFFLEEVWDKSLSDQAVARAWRMGATGPVHVETLVAKGSVEETALKKGTSRRHADKSNFPSEYLKTKAKILLQSLRYITDSSDDSSDDSEQVREIQESIAKKRVKSTLPQEAGAAKKKVRFSLPLSGRIY